MRTKIGKNYFVRTNIVQTRGFRKKSVVDISAINF